MTALHSPLPWRTHAANEWPIYVSADDYGVAMMDGPLERRAGDAALIVLAVNNHDRLVAALKDVMAQFMDGAFVRNTAGDHEANWALKMVGIVRVLAEADAALAAVKAQA